MAESVARLYAKEGANIYLIGRNKDKLQNIERDLVVRGANSVHSTTFEANDFSSHQTIVETAFNTLTKVDVFFIAHGSLPNQELCQVNAAKTIEEINTNGLSVISILTYAANFLEQQKFGNITVISSVAGERGRQSNYVYGASKGLVSIFLQGLSQRLTKSGVHVLDIKPGFVDTPMTKEFEKGILWAKPANVAKVIKKRIDNKSSFSYVPFIWFIIMTIIKTIPHTIFNKIRL